MSTHEPHVANHYTHFLRRLDRVTEGHLELAMALYTDHELLKLVLQRAHIPEGAERVAVSLDSVHEGPFVVLTRSGAFVTCLAKHMKPHGLPVIRRHELEAAAAQLARMREQLERVSRLEREATQESTLARFSRISLVLSAMPREDFLEMARFDALLGDYFHNLLFASATVVQRIVPELAWIRSARPTSAHEERLENWWNLFWQVSNLHVLANVGNVNDRCARIDARSPVADEPARVASSTQITAGVPLVQTTSRAIWSSMLHIDPILEIAARVDGTDGFTRVVRDTTLNAIAIGSARGRRGALQLLACRAHERGEIDAPMAPFLEHARRDPEQAIDDFTLYAQEMIAADRGGDPRDVPADVARAMSVAGQGDWLGDPVSLHVLARAVPWLAVADASELFVPAAWAQSIAFTPARALSLVRSIASARGLGRPKPAKREATPERNERCACGSGQKYKRCCMRAPMRVAA